MPIYDITVGPGLTFSESYRVEADSLEEAKEAAMNHFIESGLCSNAFYAYGEESGNQESKADFSVKN